MLGTAAFLAQRAFNRRNMSGRKRKRWWSSATSAPKRFKKGTNRTGGFFGRYNGSRRNRSLWHARGDVQGNGYELKFHDFTLNPTIVANTGTIMFATFITIPEGVGEEQRIGRKITLKSFGFRGSLNLPETTDQSTTADKVRLYIYQDTQCNGATAAVLEILKLADVDSYRNLSFTHRYKILFAKTYTLNQIAAGGNGTAIETCDMLKPVSIYFKMNMPIIYNQTLTTGALSTVESNNIGMLIISINGLATLQGEGRIRYQD